MSRGGGRVVTWDQRQNESVFIFKFQGWTIKYNPINADKYPHRNEKYLLIHVKHNQKRLSLFCDACFETHFLSG